MQKSADSQMTLTYRAMRPFSAARASGHTCGFNPIDAPSL